MTSVWMRASLRSKCTTCHDDPIGNEPVQVPTWQFRTDEEAGGTPYLGSDEVRCFVTNVPMAVEHTEDILVSLSCKILGWAHGRTEGIY
jgi:hypothetical protein